MSFSNIFSQFVAYLLILLTVFFAEYKFLNLMKSSLSIIYFMDHVFGVSSKRHGQTLAHPDFVEGQDYGDRIHGCQGLGGEGMNRQRTEDF